MAITISVGWWLAPLGVTAWAMTSAWRGRESVPKTRETVLWKMGLFLVALCLSLAAWLAWAVM